MIETLKPVPQQWVEINYEGVPLPLLSLDRLSSFCTTGTQEYGSKERSEDGKNFLTCVSTLDVAHLKVLSLGLLSEVEVWLHGQRCASWRCRQTNTS